MTELKRCPFCGDEVEKHKLMLDAHNEEEASNYTGKYSYFIHCDNINCSFRPETMLHQTIDGAIEEWNRRPIEDELSTEMVSCEARHEIVEDKLLHDKHKLENEVDELQAEIDRLKVKITELNFDLSDYSEVIRLRGEQ